MIDELIIDNTKIYIKDNNANKLDNFIYYHILPYKNINEYAQFRDIILRAFGGQQHSTIRGILQGNKNGVSLYMLIPSWFEKGFDAVLRSYFPDCSREKYTKERFVQNTGQEQGQEYFIQTQHNTLQDIQGNLYEHVIRLFQSIDANESLSICTSLFIGEKRGIWSGIQGFFGRNRSYHDTSSSDKKLFPTSISCIIASQNRDRLYIIQQAMQTVFAGSSMYIQFRARPWYISLSTQQLNNFFSLQTTATNGNDLQGIRVTEYKTFPIPQELQEKPGQDLALYAGTSLYQGESYTISLPYEAFEKHMYIIGKTGSGKSTFMKNTIVQLAQNNKGIIVFDPHGDLITNIISLLPSHRTNDIVYLDFADVDYPIGLNLLSRKDENEKNLLVSGLITGFKKIFGHSRGPRMEYVMRNGLLSVLSYPHATLLDFMALLTNKKRRQEILSHVTDDLLLSFRKNEFEILQDKQRQEVISPITNKIGQLLSSENVRNIFGQKHSTVDFFECLQQEKIILINIPKGKMGEDISSFVGSLLLSKIEVAILQRANQNLEKRKMNYLFIDECHAFVTESFANMLSETRKYGLRVILANQYLDQLQGQLLSAIFGNIGSYTIFAVGGIDAQKIAIELKNNVTAKDIMYLKQYTAYVIRNTSSGVSPICHLHLYDNILQYLPTKRADKDIVIKEARHRYAVDKEVAQVSIRKSLDTIEMYKQTTTKQTDTLREKDILYTTVPEHKETTQPIQKKSRIETNGQDIDIQIGSTYIGEVKIKFNYGLFVTVGNNEGLLHKNDIISDEKNSRKKLYKEGDSITVIAKGFKEIDGKKRVIWSQDI